MSKGKSQATASKLNNDKNHKKVTPGKDEFGNIKTYDPKSKLARLLKRRHHRKVNVRTVFVF